jgi:hypothetical protein
MRRRAKTLGGLADGASTVRGAASLLVRYWQQISERACTAGSAAVRCVDSSAFQAGRPRRWMAGSTIASRQVLGAVDFEARAKRLGAALGPLAGRSSHLHGMTRSVLGIVTDLDWAALAAYCQAYVRWPRPSGS